MSDVRRALRDLPSLQIEAGDYVLLLEDGTAELVRPLLNVEAIRVACEAGALVVIPPSDPFLPAAWRHVPPPPSLPHARLKVLP